MGWMWIQWSNTKLWSSPKEPWKISLQSMFLKLIILKYPLLVRPLQALVVLDFKLTIDNMTAADVQLGRRGEAVSSINLSSPTPPVLLHWTHHKDSMYIMTLGDWNGLDPIPGSIPLTTLSFTKVNVWGRSVCFLSSLSVFAISEVWVGPSGH